MNGSGYIELQVTSNFSFLRGGSHPEELVERAAALGHPAIAITDRNSLAGIVRAHKACKGKSIRLIPACRIDLLDAPPLLAYPVNRQGYATLSALLSKGNLRAEKGKCHLYRADLAVCAEDMLLVAIPPDVLDHNYCIDTTFVSHLKEYKRMFGACLYVAAVRTYQANDAKRLFRIAALSQELGIPMVAMNDVHYHVPERRELQDVITCVREKCTIHDAGFRLWQNAERYLKGEEEMRRLFAQYPEAIDNTVHMAALCRFSLSELKYVYPEEITSSGRTPQEELEHLTWLGAHEQFGQEIPPPVLANIRHELEFIRKKDYAAYFLTVYDFVRFARENDILCQGRGSAANSTVCFCLGITSVNPAHFRLLFSRFMSDARDEPPDIDVDFEHERREEVIQYIYKKYGRHRAAIVATVTQQHYRGAVRDVAKAMGLSVDAVNSLASSGWEFTEEWYAGSQQSTAGFNAQDPHLRKILSLTDQYIGFPRQLGQHTGGFVITQSKITDLCPILNARMADRTNIEWNKDDIETLGFLKVDVLALGMLTCIRKGFDLAMAHYEKRFTLANIPRDDPKVYEMISHADTLGVFQIESRAQMSMLPRMKPKNFYDLVIEVAIVRPGPIQGDMVHPYLRRRNGEEPVEYPSKELEEILGRTLGVPLFQEQAMEIAIVAAGFTPSEADQLRRSMATFKALGEVSRFEKKLVSGMVAKGYTQQFAERVFRQLEGFGSYGFPESHAASFAQLVYVSSWMKCYYPDVFAAALLNSQPMGFYQPAQIVADAVKHGVTVRPVDVNASCWDNTLEEKCGAFCALRLGFRQVKGLREQDMQLLMAAREPQFTRIAELVDAGVPVAALELLADADAFSGLGMNRRQAMWEISALKDHPVGLFSGLHQQEEQVELPLMSLSQEVIEDYRTVTLSLKGHPVAFIRNKLSLLNAAQHASLKTMKDGVPVRIAGLVLVRQRPGTAKGVCFITLEDETGIANLVVFENLFHRFRREIVHSRLLMVDGKLQVEGEVIHVVVTKCYDLTGMLAPLPAHEERASTDMTMQEEQYYHDTRGGKLPDTGKSARDVFYGGRNFR